MAYKAWHTGRSLLDTGYNLATGRGRAQRVRDVNQSTLACLSCIC